MADADIWDIAEAIAAAFNDDKASFEIPTFTADAKIVPRYDLKDLQNVAVDVVVLEDVGTRQSRSDWQHEYTCGVVVQQQRKGLDTDKTQGRQLLRLTQEFADYFKTHQLAPQLTFFPAVFTRLFDPDILESRKVFYSVARLTFRGWR